jgi:peptidyl-tRNA hydrolase, PTH1 family
MGWLEKIRDFLSLSRATEKIDIVIFGLGNPEEKYYNTRHNIGFKVADTFSSCLRTVKKVRSKEAEIIIGSFEVTKRVAVVKPLTYMNHSGIAIEYVLKKWCVPLASSIIIVDDFHIPLCSIRVRKNGSSGGHNGLKSIEAHVGSDYPRLRMGIGPLHKGVSIIDFVLGQFSEHDLEIHKEIIPKAVEALKSFIDEGVEVTMNEFNK